MWVLTMIDQIYLEKMETILTSIFPSWNAAMHSATNLENCNGTIVFRSFQ